MKKCELCVCHVKLSHSQACRGLPLVLIAAMDTTHISLVSNVCAWCTHPLYFMTFCWFWQKGVNSWRCVCVLMSGFSLFPVSLVCFHCSNLILFLVTSPYQIPCFKEQHSWASLCACVCVGVQVMIFLTAVERHWYCSTLLMKHPLSCQHTYTHSHFWPHRLLYNTIYSWFVSRLRVLVQLTQSRPDSHHTWKLAGDSTVCNRAEQWY